MEGKKDIVPLSLTERSFSSAIACMDCNWDTRTCERHSLLFFSSFLSRRRIETPLIYARQLEEHIPNGGKHGVFNQAIGRLVIRGGLAEQLIAAVMIPSGTDPVCYPGMLVTARCLNCHELE